MDDDAEPPPDYAALVERELRVADQLPRIERLWATILGHYQDEARRMRWTR